MTALLLTLGGSPSSAAATAVDLGAAETFGVLASASVTNTGPSLITGDVGVSPGTAVTGFPPGTVLGTIHAADAVADQAQSDLTTAYDVVAGQPSDELVTADLAGRTLTSGVYTAPSSMGLSGELTLDAQGDPFAVFVFQAGSTLITASGSQVTLTNGAQACNVFWQVGSSATLGTGSTFRGTILALTSIGATTGATVEGRLLARTGSVTLDNNIITQPECATVPTGTGGTGTGVPTTGGAGSDVPTTGGAGSDVPTTGGADIDVPTTGTAIQLPPRQSSHNPTPGKKQVTPTPEGFPDAGEGGSVTGPNLVLVGGGSLALLLAGALLVWWRRTTSRD